MRASSVGEGARGGVRARLNAFAWDPRAQMPGLLAAPLTGSWQSMSDVLCFT